MAWFGERKEQQRDAAAFVERGCPSEITLAVLLALAENTAAQPSPLVPLVEIESAADRYLAGRATIDELTATIWRCSPEVLRASFAYEDEPATPRLAAPIGPLDEQRSGRGGGAGAVRDLFHSTQVRLLRRDDLSADDYEAAIDTVDVNDAVTARAHLAMAGFAERSWRRGSKTLSTPGDATDRCERQILFTSFYGYLAARRSNNRHRETLPAPSARAASEAEALDGPRRDADRIDQVLGGVDWCGLAEPGVNGLADLQDECRRRLSDLDRDCSLSDQLLAAGWDAFAYGVAVALLEEAAAWPKMPDVLASVDPLTAPRPAPVRPGPAGAAPGDAVMAAVLDRIADGLGIDEFSTRTDRQLRWWAHEHAQTFTVSRPHDEVRVHAQVAVATHVDSASTDVNAVVEAFNLHASFCALVHDPSDGSVTLNTTGYFTEATLSSTAFSLFAFGALLGNWEATVRANGLATLLGGADAASHHPDLGPRDQPHASLLAMNEVPSHGAGPSIFDDELLAQIADGELIPWESVAAGPQGLIGRFAVGDQVATTAIVTGAPHPTYGNGALILTRVPAGGPGSHRLAREWNTAETWGHTDVQQCGAWVTDPDDDSEIVHTVFVPNYASSLSPLPTLAVLEWLRCDWLASRLSW